jgi:hypothetical protein
LPYFIRKDIDAEVGNTYNSMLGPPFDKFTDPIIN